MINCNIDEAQQKQIIEKARILQRENEAFKQTIEGMQAVDDESLEEVDDEEYMRMRYFEAMRRAQYDQMMQAKA